MQIAFPYELGESKLTGLTDELAHRRQMLEMLLFTIPGERVNRPDFGCGIQRAVFAPQQSEVTATLSALVRSEIHRWLGDVLTLERLEIISDEATLRVQLQYRLPDIDAPVEELFERSA